MYRIVGRYSFQKEESWYSSLGVFQTREKANEVLEKVINDGKRRGVSDFYGRVVSYELLYSFDDVVEAWENEMDSERDWADIMKSACKERGMNFSQIYDSFRYLTQSHTIPHMDGGFQCEGVPTGIKHIGNGRFVALCSRCGKKIA